MTIRTFTTVDLPSRRLKTLLPATKSNHELQLRLETRPACIFYPIKGSIFELITGLKKGSLTFSHIVAFTARSVVICGLLKLAFHINDTLKIYHVQRYSKFYHFTSRQPVMLTLRRATHTTNCTVCIYWLIAFSIVFSLSFYPLSTFCAYKKPKSTSSRENLQTSSFNARLTGEGSFSSESNRTRSKHLDLSFHSPPPFYHSFKLQFFGRLQPFLQVLLLGMLLW